jgi:transcriptional regulator with XRE-family HTH domain
MYGNIVVRVHELIKEKNLTQKALAEGMGKKPSEISKWLNGEHNFTLRSLAKLEAELGEPIITVPKWKAFAQASHKALQLKASISHLPKESTFASGKFQAEEKETQVA